MFGFLKRGGYGTSPWGRIYPWFLRAWLLTLVATIVVATASSFVTEAGKPLSNGWAGVSVALGVLAVTIVVTGASAVVAWLFGLLFGIPRSLARARFDGEGSRASSGTAGAAASRINTNLEDVSDWLTKTIIGVGLTQIYLLPSFAWSVAEKLKRASGLGDQAGGPVLLLGLVLQLRI